MILVSRNIIRYIRILAEVPSGRGVKYIYNKCYAYVQTLSMSFEYVEYSVFRIYTR